MCSSSNNSSENYDKFSSPVHTPINWDIPSDKSGLLRNSMSKIKESKKLEVGAGAKIKQKLHDDIESLDYWKDEPESLICINYCLEDDCSEIIKIKEENKNEEGFLKDMMVGV